MYEEARKAIKGAKLVLCYAQSTGLIFSVTKTLAHTINIRAQQSAGFKFTDAAGTVTLYI